MNCGQILILTMMASKSRIVKEKGKSFYKSFFRSSKRILKEILPNVPDIGNSLFSFVLTINSAFAILHGTRH